jgi:hypothetical protein
LPQTKERRKQCMSGLLLSQRLFYEGIQKLLERWNKCIAKHGDSTEKLYNCEVSAIVEINYKICVWILFDLPKYYQKKDLRAISVLH